MRANAELELPIQGYFLIERQPVSEVPEVINQQWLDLFLPLRYETIQEAPRKVDMGVTILSEEPLPITDAVPVLLVDAVATLRRAGLEHAADWWQNNWDDHDLLIRKLIFERQCGRIVTATMKESFYPDLS